MGGRCVCMEPRRLPLALSSGLRSSLTSENKQGAACTSLNACAQALASMLAANATLTMLSVGDSKFGCEGMARLAPGVGASRSLTHLDAELKVRSAPWQSTNCCCACGLA